MAAPRYIKNSAGQLVAAPAIETSAGVADAEKIVATGAAGVLDASLVNSTQSSAGAGDAAKVVALDGSGRIDASMLPVGVSADSKTITASETIAAGAFVNLHDSSGLKVRNADASNGRVAHGFTLLGAANGAPCVVYFEGADTALSGKTPGAFQYLSASTPGASTETAPSTAGQYVQVLGIATVATEVNFEPQPSILLS